MSIAEIQQAVSDLPEVERGTLAAWLLDSLPPHSHEDASAEGIREAARRREELNSGRVRALSSDEFWASIERLRATWK
jgi:Putative addiction module component